MRSVVLLSGGIDSATCLALALRTGGSVSAITVAYGQRHGVERESARRICDFYKIEDHCEIDVPIGIFGGSTLTDCNLQPRNTGVMPGIADTYVPARNTILLAVAAAFAETRNADSIFIGANKTDNEGYPDCRPAYFESYQKTLALGTTVTPVIKRPLVNMLKVDVVRLASDLAVPLELTWSCYDPQKQEHCGRCDACRVRRSAFTEADVVDPTRYVT